VQKKTPGVSEQLYEGVQNIVHPMCVATVAAVQHPWHALIRLDALKKCSVPESGVEISHEKG
jgi:hypothetical protein